MPRLPLACAQLRLRFYADLTSEVAFDLIRHVTRCRQVAEMLVALKQNQKRQLTAAGSRVILYKSYFAGRWLVERLELALRKRRFEPRVRRAFDRRHR